MVKMFDWQIFTGRLLKFMVRVQWVMERNVRKWCWWFKEGRTNVHEKEQSGSPSVVTDDFKQQLNAKIWENI
jgi:hypothetical protein